MTNYFGNMSAYIWMNMTMIQVMWVILLISSAFEGKRGDDEVRDFDAAQTRR